MAMAGKKQGKARKLKGVSRPAGEQSIESERYFQIAKAIRRMQPGYCVRA